MERSRSVGSSLRDGFEVRGLGSGGGRVNWGGGGRLEIKRQCSFQELLIEFHSNPFHFNSIHSIPSQCHFISILKEIFVLGLYGS